MGYVVIKASGNAYALNRSMQNLIPVDSNYRKLIPNNATFAYKHVTLQGICTLDSVDLKNGTLPYEYRLCDSQGNLLDTNTPRPGVLVNPINGVITLGENYDEQDVWVRLYPLIKTGYYATNTPKIYVKAVTAGDWSPGITPEHTASLDAVVYSFGNNLNWNSNSLTAAETLLTLASVTVTYDGELSTFSGNDLNNFITDVTNISIVGMVDNTRIVNVTNNLRQFTVPANTSSSRRAILFEVSFKYKGISVSYVLPNALMQAANVLSNVENVKYGNNTSGITLNVGTTLSTNDFTATGNYSNGTSASIHPTDIKLDESSVNSVVEGEQTYTLNFGNSVTATFTITGQAAVTNKTYISDIAGTPYPSKIANTYEWPLYVNVVHGSNGSSEQLTFALYNALNEVKETYASPEITFTTNKQYYNMPSVNENGSLVYDFTADNYVYDITKVTDIAIQCTSGGANVSKDPLISYSDIKKHKTDTDYFTENFNEPILLSTSNYLTEFSGLTTHVSDSSDTANGHITLSNNSGGTVYILDKEKLSNAGIANDNFYIYVTGYQGAIISKSGDLTSGTYDKSTNVKVMWPDSQSQGIYIHHTPTSSNYTTYLIYGTVYSGSQAAKWYILTPKASEYGPINITSEISVSPATIPASGGTITITPPTYSQTHGSETITSDANTTYTLDGVQVTPSSNNTLLLSENLTNRERSRVLVATITLNGKTATSAVTITQEANTSVTAPTIASIVSSDPYDIITGGTLVTNDNKEQVEFPLQITLSNGTSTTLEDYQNTYGANSLYSGVTILKSSSSSDSVGAYPNDFKINSTNGNIIYDFKDDSFAWDRSKITSITINGKTGVPNVALNSGISSIYAHLSSLLTPHFEEKLDWASLSFTTSGTKYKLDISSDGGATRLGLQTSSSANRLKKLTAASDGAYYIRFRSTDWPTISVFELPQGTTISTDLDLRNVNKRVLRIGGSPSTVATDWKYIKLTPTAANANIYYADNSSDGDVQLGSIKNN